MSSYAASCSTCCRRASCASATSASSPTGAVLHCCHCAYYYSADHSKTQLRRHHRPQIRLIHSGTAQSAAVPCASLNGSLLPNSCFAPHLNQNGALHEPLSTSSVFARASARTRMPCLIRPKTLRYQPLQRPNQASKSHGPPPFGLQANRLHQTPPVRDPSAPTRADSKYIGFPVGGFLQAAVSGAPLSEHANPSCFAGRSRYSTKTFEDSSRAHKLRELRKLSQLPVKSDNTPGTQLCAASRWPTISGYQGLGWNRTL